MNKRFGGCCAFFAGAWLFLAFGTASAQVLPPLPPLPGGAVPASQGWVGSPPSASPQAVTTTTNVPPSVTINLPPAPDPGMQSIENPVSPVSSDPAPAVQPGQATPAPPQEGLVRSGPGTASEQGAAPALSPAELEALRRAAEDELVFNSPMQRGDVVPFGSYGNVISSDRGGQAVLSQWRVALQCAGVTPDKVALESERLSRQSFEMWASRIIWAYDPQGRCVRR